MPERDGGIRCSSGRRGHCCVCNRALPENTPYPRVNKGEHCVSSCFSRLFLFGCVPSFVACAKHAKCGKKIAILNHRLIPLCNLSDLLFSALCDEYEKANAPCQWCIRFCCIEPLKPAYRMGWYSTNASIAS